MPLKGHKLNGASSAMLGALRQAVRQGIQVMLASSDLDRRLSRAAALDVDRPNGG
jgi:hypothetical protein